MRQFTYERAVDAADAVRRHLGYADDPDGSPAYCAGGTTLIDLAKLGVLQPAHVIDILDLRKQHGSITVSDDALVIGALATMAEAAAHPEVHQRHPALRQALLHAASPQLRNTATIGGNLLQRTRCTYFRDSLSPCNKRVPGSGCAAIGGDTRALAILGTSAHCIANYPGDLAVALTALGATVTIHGIDGASRTRPVDGLHLLPGDSPHVETDLRVGEVITAVTVPRRHFDTSLFRKVRDRSSYAFALVSAAVAVRWDGERVDDIGIALEGLATTPWRCRDAENTVRGQRLTSTLIRDAADQCLRDTSTDSHTNFKRDLGIRLVTQALSSISP